MKRQISYLLVASATLFAASEVAQERRERADLVIAGGTIGTMDPERHILEDGAIAIKGDTVLGVGSRAQIDAKYTAATQIDAAGEKPALRS